MTWRLRGGRVWCALPWGAPSGLTVGGRSGQHRREMNVYDLIVCLLVALLAWRGLRRGLIGELLGLVVFACGLLLALRVDAVVGRRLVAIIPSLSATEGRVLAFFAVLLAVGIIVGALGRRLTRLVSHIPLVGGLNRLGGLLLGAALAVACVWLVTAAVVVLPRGLVPFSATVRHSETAHLLRSLGPGVDSDLRAHLGQIGDIRGATTAGFVSKRAAGFAPGRTAAPGSQRTAGSRSRSARPRPGRSARPPTGEAQRDFGIVIS